MSRDVPSIDELRARVEAAGFSVAPDRTIGLRAVAMLVKRAPKTLRNQMSLGTGPEAETDTGRIRCTLDNVWLYLVNRVDRRRRS